MEPAANAPAYETSRRSFHASESEAVDAGAPGFSQESPAGEYGLMRAKAPGEPLEKKQKNPAR